MQTDALDRTLLDLLGENARMPTAEIDRRLKTVAHDGQSRLERGGAILGYMIRPGREAALRPMNPVRALHAVSERSL